jgi:release factor glutamine methyltransferase
MDNTISSGDANVAEPATVAALLEAARESAVDRLDAEVLLANLSRQTRAQLTAFAETLIDPLTAALYRACIARRAEGEPLAYITGIREFWSLPLVVTPAVLVPRPETELLVERCLQLLDAGARRVADLGTGSGAVAIALARERPRWMLCATDTSAAALEIAAVNCKRLRCDNIQLRQGSWCDALEGDRFDAIVSNPPYIRENDEALATLQHEPRSALVARDDGFSDLLAIARSARSWLKPGAVLLLEHGAGQRERLAAELVALGYARVVCHRDLAGRDRVTEAFKS